MKSQTQKIQINHTPPGNNSNRKIAKKRLQAAVEIPQISPDWICEQKKLLTEQFLEIQSRLAFLQHQIKSIHREFKKQLRGI